MPNVTRFEAGAPSDWKSFRYTHPAIGRESRGKLFLGERLDLRSMEISLNSFAPNGTMPFAHRHARCEEVYLFLDGKGEFRVDDERFEVGPGSVVRVAPDGVRTWRSTNAEPLVFVVIQAIPQDEPVRAIDDGRLAPLEAWP